MTLPQISLDPRNETTLLEQAAQFAIDRSGGQLGNLSPANPLLFLLEAQVFAGSELLFYLNQLPDRLLIQFLNYWGVSTSPGNFATGTLNATLSTTLNSPLVIPSNLLFSDGQNLYRSTTSVTVPANTSTATIPIRCESLGLIGNANPYTINSIVTPSPFIRSVTNPAALVGGTDPLDTDTAISNYISNLRDNQIVSEQDIIRESKKLIGTDWDVRVLPNLDPTSNQTQYGTVAVLIGSPTNDTPQSTATTLQQHLQSRVQLTTRVWVSLLEYKPTIVKVYGTYEGGDPQGLADDLYERLQRFITTSPLSIDGNDLIRLAHDSGIKLMGHAINDKPRVSVLNKREAINLKYLEINLTPDNLERVRGKDDTGLLWSDTMGQVFIYGQGDEN